MWDTDAKDGVSGFRRVSTLGIARSRACKVAEVVDWLISIGMREYDWRFRQNSVDGEVLALCSVREFLHMGIFIGPARVSASVLAYGCQVDARRAGLQGALLAWPLALRVGPWLAWPYASVASPQTHVSPPVAVVPRPSRSSSACARCPAMSALRSASGSRPDMRCGQPKCRRA